MTLNRIDVNDPNYTPVKLINATASKLGATSECDLAMRLGMSPSQLLRIRRREQPVSNRMMVLIMDHTDWHIQKVRELMGVPFDER